MKKSLLMLVAIAAGLTLQLSSSAQSARRLNFIVILTDDQGYNDLGCNGSPFIKTPNIDRMAREGMRLTNFYAQPICGPSRTALMTGCYPLRVAEVGNIKRMHPMVHPDEILLPEVLKTGGYVSECIGKWDMNGHAQTFAREDILPTRMGFDYWYGLPQSNDRVAKLYRNENVIDTSVSMDTLTQLYTQEALQFIEKNKDRKFFLYLAHSMPHTKLGASSRFKGKSSFGLYGDAIEEIDWSTGMIRQKLIDLGLDKNTIVIYLSDNGPWYVRETHGGSAFPLRGEKITTWEGGVRVPCVIWGAGIRRGVVSDQMAASMDIFPTFAKLAGLKIPADRIIDGKDISSLFSDPKSKVRDVYYYYLYTHLEAVRSGDWKLVLPRPQAPEWIPGLNKKSAYRMEDIEPVRDYELYNLKSDPAERRSVAESHPEVVQSLLKIVDKAREDIGDYDLVGKGARFFDSGTKRPDAIMWAEKEKAGWKQEIKIHPYYDDGSRNLW